MSSRPRKKSVKHRDLQKTPPPERRRPADAILFDAASEITGPRVAVVSAGGGHAAAEIARTHPDARVSCTFFDVFLADSARRHNEGIENLKFLCESDLPDEPTDSVVLALPTKGENELARDLLQQTRQRLTENGRLFASTDNPKDHWVHEQLKGMFEKVTNRGSEHGRLYIGSRPKPLKKIKSLDCWFAMRDGEHLVDLYSRPGVFSHRRLDLGARALIESLTILDGPHAGEVVRDGMHILDVGCGSGAVGFAASMRAANVQVHSLDANARALHCTQVGAEKNRLTRLTTQLEAEGRCERPGTFDLVLANPPYYSNYHIGEIFLLATQAALRSGGRTHFVTKQPEWYADQFSERFVDVSVREIRGYFVVKGTLP